MESCFHIDFIHKLIWKSISLKQTFSDAVARRVPCRFSAMQLSAVSCASISSGALSVLARSTTSTCPVFSPGNASKELLLFGHNTHKPETQMKHYLLLTNTMTCIQCHILLSRFWTRELAKWWEQYLMVSLRDMNYFCDIMEVCYAAFNGSHTPGFESLITGSNCNLTCYKQLECSIS
jgi:hypothetical protein